MGQVVSIYDYEDRRTINPPVTRDQPATIILLPQIRVEPLRPEKPPRLPNPVAR